MTIFKISVSGVYTRDDDPKGPGREVFAMIQSFSVESALNDINGILLDPGAPACAEWLDYEGVSGIHRLPGLPDDSAPDCSAGEEVRFMDEIELETPDTHEDAIKAMVKTLQDMADRGDNAK